MGLTLIQEAHTGNSLDKVKAALVNKNNILICPGHCGLKDSFVFYIFLIIGPTKICEL